MAMATLYNLEIRICAEYPRGESLSFITAMTLTAGCGGSRHVGFLIRRYSGFEKVCN